MAKPGVMFYFDIRPCIKRLNLAEKGQLFEAILDYAQLGVNPELDGVLGIAWDFIQPRLDKDSGKYDAMVEKKQYAAFVREAKKQGNDTISFEEWKMLPDIKENQVISDDAKEDPMPPENISRYPTTTTTSTSTSTTTSTSTSTSASNTTSTIRGSKAAKPPTRARFVPPEVQEVREYCRENGYTAIDPERFVNFYQSKGWKIGKDPMKDWKAAVRGWNSRDKPEPKKHFLDYQEGENWTL